MNSIELTDTTFESTSNFSTSTVLVYFGAEWCSSCRAMDSVMNSLADELPGKATITKVDVDANPLTTARYGIRNLPTIILFKNGVAVERIIGIVPRDVLYKKLEFTAA